MELVLLLDAGRADENNISAKGTVASVGLVGNLGKLIGLGLLRSLKSNELSKQHH